MDIMQIQQKSKFQRRLLRCGKCLKAGTGMAFLVPAFTILLFLFILPIYYLNTQEKRKTRNVLFGVTLSHKAKSLLAEVEQIFDKEVREEWLKEDDGLASMSGNSKVDDDGVPIIWINPAHGRKIDVIVHELYHFKLRAQGYPVIQWLYPKYMDAEANGAILNQLNQQMHDPILHYIFYREARAWGIDPGETFEGRTKRALEDNSLATIFTNMDKEAIGLYYFKIRLEVNDPVLLQLLEKLLERKQKQSGIEFGKRLSQIVIGSNPQSPEEDIKTLVDCLNALYEGKFHFKQHSWKFRQLGKHRQQVAPIEMQPLG